MSARMTRKAAKQTIVDTDAILRRWQEYFGSDEIKPGESGEIIDRLLDLRNAANDLLSPTEKAAA